MGGRQANLQGKSGEPLLGPGPNHRDPGWDGDDLPRAPASAPRLYCENRTWTWVVTQCDNLPHSGGRYPHSALHYQQNLEEEALLLTTPSSIGFVFH
jgi:hypothetical protein